MSAKQTEAVARPNREQLALTGKKIDEIRLRHETALAEATNDFERAFALSCALIDLRQAVKEYLPVLKQLAGSKLGFLTDRDPGKDYKNAGPYADQVVVDCAIEAVMHGAAWTGNEFNILAGGCFLTKNYWWRKVNQIEGLTDLDLNPGIPEFVNQKCVVEFQAGWKLNGRPFHMTRRFSIIVRSGQGDDATLGKAEARMLKAIYRKVTGTEITDAGDDEPVAAKPATAPAAPPNGTRPALAAKCDGGHGAPACGDPECWQLDPPEGDDSGEVFDWSAGDDAKAKHEAGEAARSPSGGRA